MPSSRFSEIALELVSIGGLGESSPADETADEGEEAFVHLGTAFVADEQAAELVQPGEGTLDNPAEAAEAGAVLGRAARDDRFDASLSELSTVALVVVAAVTDELIGPATRPAGKAARTAGTRSRSGISWVTSWRLPPVRA